MQQERHTAGQVFREAARPAWRRIWFVDFDHTLFDTDRFFHVDVRKSFLGLGIDVELWERAYLEVLPLGYTLEKHVQAVHALSGDEYPLEQMKEVLDCGYADLEKYLFPDVVPFLRVAKERGDDLAVLSFGNPTWQKYKVRASGIEPWFDHLFFTDRHGSKIEVMREHGVSYDDVAFIDNHPNELDAAKDFDGRIRTFLVNRVPDDRVLESLPPNSFLEAKRYNRIVSRNNHQPCTTLEEILS